MNTRIHESVRDDKGFTLVELAIVMVIIGLLIGGILKGQEMIANAQVNATIAQISGVDAASSTFRDMYDAMPGDMLLATTRIPGCAAPCINGGGNNSINSLPLVAAPGTEATNLFRHLGGADLLAGVTANMPAGTYLQAKINNVQLVPGSQAAAALGNAAANVARSGLYVGLSATGATGNTAALTPLQAGRIDRKRDDGNAITGSVIGGGGATCATAAGLYVENTQTATCILAARIN